LTMFGANVSEFLAEDTPITIIPKFRHDVLHFISGDFGPFTPQSPVEVPLWLAVTLKKRQKCQIKPPEWMDAEHLVNKLEREKTNDEFQDLPYHFMEIVSILFNSAVDDIEDADRIRTLLEDIQNVRQTKIRKGMQSVADDVRDGGTITSVKLNNIGSIEINSVRPFLVEALDKFFVYSNAGASNADATGAAGNSGGAEGEGETRRLRRFT